ncbi:MAG: FHA domain-containing protein [Pseudonocardiaceae bacterium]
MATLVLEIVEGNDRGREVPLDRELQVGRGDVTLALDDEQVSRHHARITPTDGGAVVRDLGSTNGTYVNDQPLHGERSIASGDRIRFGLTVLGLRAAGESLAVGSRPDVTQVGHGVLQPATDVELAPPPPREASVPSFLVEESEPAFVPRQLVGDADAESDYGALARLVDKKVKQQTNVAAFAVLAFGGLAVLIFFGVS